jgi:hypothetical protein
MLAAIFVLSAYYEGAGQLLLRTINQRRQLASRLRQHFTLLGQIGGC